MKSYIQLASLIILIILAYQSELPNGHSIDDNFNLQNAKNHLIEIASKPHETGSQQNIKVRDYLDSTLNSYGFEVKIVESIFTANKSGRIHHSKTQNIIAKKRGNGKQVIGVMAHYDSAISASGAADDGQAVAAMLDLARQYTSNTQNNDLWLIITDGEEVGLMGSHELVAGGVLDSLDVLFNFEARGNSGPTRAFEWGEGNYNMVDFYRSNTPQPISNSLSYEVYKRMPNGTDFSAVKSFVPGINMAMIDGFSYYHSPMDLPENLNEKSFFHTGSTMMALVDSAKQMNLSELTSVINGTFFNLYGWFVLYPAFLDYVFLLFGFLGLGYLYRIYRRENELIISHVLLSIGSILLAIILSGGLTWLMVALIKNVYPHYFAFYMGHFYNHSYYLIAGLGISLLSIVLVGRLILKKVSFESYSMASLILMFILSVVVLVSATTAAFVFVLPCLIWTLGLLTSKKSKKEIWGLASILLIVVGVGLWGNLIYNLFLVFSLRVLWIPMVLATLFLSLLVVATEDFFSNKYLPILVSIGLILIGFIGGHLKSKPTQKKPVVSELNYLKDLDSAEGYWMAVYGMKTEDNLQKLEGSSKGALPGYFSRALVKKESITIDSTLVLNTKVKKDSSNLQMTIYDSGALYTMIEFDPNSIDSVWINEDLVNHRDPASKAIFITGYTSGNIEVKAKSNTQRILSGNVYSFVKGMPEDAPVLEGHVRSGQFTILKRKF